MCFEGSWCCWAYTPALPAMLSAKLWWRPLLIGLSVNREWLVNVQWQWTYCVVDVYDAILIMWSIACSFELSFMGMRAWRSLSVQGRSASSSARHRWKPLRAQKNLWEVKSLSGLDLTIHCLEIGAKYSCDWYIFFFYSHFSQGQKTLGAGVFLHLVCEWVGGSFVVKNQGLKSTQVSRFYLHAIWWDLWNQR